MHPKRKLDDPLTDAAPICSADAPTFSQGEATDRAQTLDAAWVVAPDGSSLTREFRFKGFAKATHTANLAAYLSDRHGHHADIAFGWGYCRVTYTSHEAGGLTEADFACAARLDRAVA